MGTKLALEWCRILHQQGTSRLRGGCMAAPNLIASRRLSGSVRLRLQVVFARACRNVEGEPEGELKHFDGKNRAEIRRQATLCALELLLP